MPDVYATITEADPATLERLIQAMEIRAAMPQQRAMLEAYLAQIEFPPGARVLEVGCGSGAIARVIAGWPGVAEVVGIDPSPTFVAKARELAQSVDRLELMQGDGRALPVESETFDVVVLHTVLSHVPDPARAVAEAARVVRRGGTVAAFDGDYATTSLASADFDPLQVCSDAAVSALVHDRWLVRRLPQLFAGAGLSPLGLCSHGYVETEPGYMLTLADRGADHLARVGTIGSELAAALKAEARRRADAGTFFGQIAYASLLGRKRG
jgi:ubiquinone/menaquinone biosynthesis C-methylase UbiE